MLSALPSALLSLLFASPVFTTTTTTTTTISTSPNDPFRAVALQVPKQPQNPICCLKLTPSEPVDDGILLSFEEWKLKQQAIQQSPVQPNEKEPTNRSTTQGSGDGSLRNEAGNSSETPASSDENSPPLGSSSPETASGGEWADFSFMQIPTTDRFNYASLDCSARVHTAHRSAKSPSSILSSKRDRYMLSPCDTSKEKHFVVVELCDDIRIDTVQLANFEFFSGVFKDFTVSVSKTYTTEPDGWTLVKSYQAKNIRGVQTFRPPTSLRDFYRFIRVDFLSHYGNEYYCPVSLLRVYGLTHLEEWKWDIWESESRQKQADLQKKRLSSLAISGTPEPPMVVDPTTQLSMELNGTNKLVVQTTTMTTVVTGTVVYHSESIISSPSPSQPDFSTSNIKKAVTSRHPTPTNEPKPSSSIDLGQNQNPTHHDGDPDIHSTHTHVSPLGTSSALPSQAHSRDQGSTIPLSESLSVTPSNSPVVISTGSHFPSGSNQSHPASDSPTIIISPSAPSVSVIPIVTTTLPPAAAVKGGESIYRTILNRLAEVETNHTLYMRYIEQQNFAIRDVIKKLGEDVGRLDGISRAQSLTYQRTLDIWERQRYQLEMEYGDLLSRIESLSEEIILEKRLGVAQLCLLLAVLVFMGLTRGSRAEALIDQSSTQINRSVREWGRRHFKFSGDWADRFKGKNLERDRSDSRSRSTSRTRTPLPIRRPRPQTAKPRPPNLPLHFQDDSQFAFPSSSSRRNNPLETIQLNSAPPGGELYTRPRTRTMSNPRSRAPSLRSTPTTRRIQHIAHQKPITPLTTTFRPHVMQRWSSQGGPIPVGGSWGSMSMPKSAKKWARTAHLHEVKTTTSTPSVDGRQYMVGENTRHDRENDRTPKEFNFERDVFSSSVTNLSTNSTPWDMNAGAGRSPTIEQSLLLKPEVIMDDGDPWVDTDSVDGSEKDLAPFSAYQIHDL